MARISRVPVWKANHLPRVRLIPSLTPSSVCAEGPPRQTRMSGLASSIWRSVNGQADLALLRRRRAVAGRAPRNDVGDIGGGAVEPDRRHHPVEQLAGASDERQPLEILLASRRLADEHHARLRVAVGEHQLLRGRAQRAALEPVSMARSSSSDAARLAASRAAITAASGGATPSRIAAQATAARRAPARRARFRAPAPNAGDRRADLRRRTSDRPALRRPSRRRLLPRRTRAVHAPRVRACHTVETFRIVIGILAER